MGFKQYHSTDGACKIFLGETILSWEEYRRIAESLGTINVRNIHGVGNGRPGSAFQACNEPNFLTPSQVSRPSHRHQFNQPSTQHPSPPRMSSSPSQTYYQLGFCPQKISTKNPLENNLYSGSASVQKQKSVNSKPKKKLESWKQRTNPATPCVFF